MNHSLLTADRNTHVRIIAVSAACVMVFLAGLAGFRVSSFDQLAGTERPAVVKASTLTTWTAQQPTTSVR